MRAPTNLAQLLRVAAPILWKGKAYERTAQRNVEEFIELVGNLGLDEVTTLTLDAWKEQQRVSSATINRKLVNIRQVLAFAVEREWMKKLPKITWEKESEGRTRWLTEDEEHRLFSILERMGEFEVAKYIRVLMDTGMRRSELLSLQRDQVRGPWIYLWKTKSGKPQQVPLNASSKEILEECLPWTFDRSHLRMVWAKVKKEMGLENDKEFVLHALRHTCATRVLRKTKNLGVVKRLLRHKNIKTTLRYAHIADEELLAAVA